MTDSTTPPTPRNTNTGCLAAMGLLTVCFWSVVCLTASGLGIAFYPQLSATLTAQGSLSVSGSGPATAAARNATATVQAGDFDELAWPKIYSDAFETADPGSGWPLGDFDDDYAVTNYSIANGKYIWDSTAHQGVILRAQFRTPSMGDFYATVEARRLGGEELTQYGLVFRDDFTNYYVFMAGDDHQFAVFMYYNYTWTTLLDLTGSASILPGDVNRLTVIAHGSHFEFYINNELTAELDDETLPIGQTGLAINLRNPGDSAAIEFDNLEVRTTAIIDPSLPQLAPTRTAAP